MEVAFFIEDYNTNKTRSRALKCLLTSRSTRTDGMVHCFGEMAESGEDGIEYAISMDGIGLSCSKTMNAKMKMKRVPSCRESSVGRLPRQVVKGKLHFIFFTEELTTDQQFLEVETISKR